MRQRLSSFNKNSAHTCLHRNSRSKTESHGVYSLLFNAKAKKVRGKMFTYPEVKRDANAVDEYHGQKVRK